MTMLDQTDQDKMTLAPPQRRAGLWRWLPGGLIGLIGLALGARLALAQGNPPQPTPGAPVTDDQVNAIASQLYCPVCQNVPLDVCGTAACADWRQEIRGMLGQGLSADQIKVKFAEKYGQRVLASPERQGIGLFVYILPLVGVIVGALVVGMIIYRMAPGALSAGPQAETAIQYDDLDPETVARLERELKEFSS